MTRVLLLRSALFGLSTLLAVGCSSSDPEAPSAASPSAASPSSTAAVGAHGSLYGRIITSDGTAYEGPLRWGGSEEAFWDHYFNGAKHENPWAAYTPLDSLKEARRPINILGFEIPRGERPFDLSRPFMARFGDIARIESRGDGLRGILEDGIEFAPEVRVTLKSGTVYDLDRLEASDFDDGVRVWDSRRGVVDLGPREIRTIEFLPNPQPGGGEDRLHGTVRTRQGDFTGFLQWDREESVGRDELVGRTNDGMLRLRFDTLLAIARHEDGVRVTRLDGREIALSGTQKVGPRNRGIYVDDRRYGRVLVSWDAFEHVDFSPGGSGPAYADFPPGRPLRGRVTTRAGHRLSGRLVYDLDESETTETLDAPSQGIDYTIPFGLIASIVLPDREERATRGTRASATVLLQSGDELRLESIGDLGPRNAGMLIFADGRARPDYVPWTDIDRVDFESPLVSAPPRLDG